MKKTTDMVTGAGIAAFVTVLSLGSGGVARQVRAEDNSGAGERGVRTGSVRPRERECHGANHRARASDRIPPVIRDSNATLNPNAAAPLVAIVNLMTDEPTRALLTISDGTRRWRISSGCSLDRSYSVHVFGLRADTSHAIEAAVLDAAGNKTQAPTMWVITAPLPTDFPPIRVDSDPHRMAPGVTFFGVGRWPFFRDPAFGLIVAVDAEGEVVWFYKTSAFAVDGVQRLSNGNLLITDLSVLTGQAAEIDMLGNTVQRWHPRLRRAPDGSTLVNTDTLHHDVIELPNGNFVALSTELRVIEGFPTLDPAAPTETANVVGDVIVEFERNGSIVREWSLFDSMDMQRLGSYLSVGTFWNATYGQDTRAWTFANSIIYIEADDSFVLSLRHQNAVVKISRGSGQLRWILGDPTGWGPSFQKYLLMPLGDATFPYAQHHPQITDRGTLLLHDNGNFRAVPPNAATPAASNFSRAVEYRIHEKGMTFEQLWEFGVNQYYSTFLGDADRLARNNVLITFGGQAKTDDGVPSDDILSSRLSAQILEVKRSHTPDIVFELTIRDPSIRYTVFRSERLDSIAQ